VTRLPHNPPRLTGEDGRSYGLFLTYCYYAHWWVRPYEAVADAHAVTQAAVATCAARWHWDVRFDSWFNTL